MSNYSRKVSVSARSGAVNNSFSLSRMGTRLLGLMLSSLVLITSASAATITVGNASDPINGNAARCNVANTCTLRDAIAKAAAVTGSATGDTIVFSLPANSTITLGGSELLVGKNLVIDGSISSNLVISANRRSHVFEISVGVTATLKQLVISQGHVDYPYGGGGIANFGSLMLINSTVSDNTASDGGGIANYSNIALIGSSVLGNTATFQGGGIRNLGNLTITNSTISGNTSLSDGGGIHSFGTLMLTDSTVSGNIISQNGAGGGIYSYDGALTLTHCKILDNTAKSIYSNSGGGGIYNMSGTLAIIQSTISGNTATSGFTGGGGGIYNSGTVATIDHTLISANTADGPYGYGGGISNYGALKLTNSTISNNIATVGGGGINGGNLTLINSAVSENTTNGDGGGIIGRDLTLTDCTVSNNRASRDGGGIHNDFPGTMILTRSTVSDNIAESGGGGIYQSSGTIKLTDNSMVSGNRANADGGGIYSYGNYSSTLMLTDSRVSNNTADGSGGGIKNQFSALELAYSTVSGNSAHGSGGAIENHGVLAMTNSTASENTAGGIGGGIYNSGTWIFTNSTIAANANSVILNNDDIYNAANRKWTFTTNTIIQSCAVDEKNTQPLTDNGGNLDGGTGCGFTDPSSKSNATLDLGALADNGGPTLTMMPGANSDAIGRGAHSACVSSPVYSRDQRGYVRSAIACTSGAVDPNGAANDSIFFDGFGFGGQ